MLPDNFAMFILCHGHPEHIDTLDALLKYGHYTGKWYIILDNEDATIPQYQENYGKEHVLVFDKAEWEKKVDLMDIGGKRGIAVFARNACFELARQNGIKYFMELDDDYHAFVFRVAHEKEPGKQCLLNLTCYHLDPVVEATLDFYKENPQIKALCYGQNGDLIGGVNNYRFKNRIIRKAMNSWLCDVDRPFNFFGRMNDDVNTYTTHGSRGGLFFTIMDCIVDAAATQIPTCGMTEVYKQDGTYKKSAYTVMCCPSFTKIAMMGQSHFRFHHNINWENAVPKLIDGKYKKQK